MKKLSILTIFFLLIFSMGCAHISTKDIESLPDFLRLEPWEGPHEEALEWVIMNGEPIREMTVESLLDDANWYFVGPLGPFNECTLHPDLILTGSKMNTHSPKTEAEIIYHVLVHVAQHRTMGWHGMEYYGHWIWDFITAGFNYKDMKKKGIEGEAYDLQADFKRRIKRMDEPDDFRERRD